MDRVAAVKPLVSSLSFTDIDNTYYAACLSKNFVHPLQA